MHAFFVLVLNRGRLAGSRPKPNLEEITPVSIGKKVFKANQLIYVQIIFHSVNDLQ